MITAVIFDVDDLMVNSEPLHIGASNRVFERFGVDVRDIPDDVVKTYFGKRVSEIIQLIAEYFNLSDEVDLEGLVREREEIFLKMVREDLEPMPGLFILIDRLRSLEYKRAIASSGTRVYIDAVLEKFNLDDFFQVIVSGDMVKEGKPDPEVFLETADQMGVKPGECVVIEDSTHGIEAAKRAGMFCIGVDNQLSPYKQDLSQADRVVSTLDQIDAPLLESF